MQFEKITDVDSAGFCEAMALYTTAFPLNEQQPLPVVKSRVQSGLNELYVGYKCDAVVFMALLWPLKKSHFILLDYMATHQQYRGQKIASDFLQQMTPLLQARKRYFIIETEHPAFGDNREERQKRLAFYKRCGANVLKDIRYMLPALQGSAPTEMLLLVFPEYRGGKMDAALVSALLVQVYKELYNRDAGEIIRLNGLNEKRFIELV